MKAYFTRICLSDIALIGEHAYLCSFSCYARINVFSIMHIDVKRDMMCQSNISVQQAMLESGFTTKSNFYREFRRVHNCSPTQWRLEQYEQVRSLDGAQRAKGRYWFYVCRFAPRSICGGCQANYVSERTCPRRSSTISRQGYEGVVPGPATQDGLELAPANPEQSTRSGKLVESMLMQLTSEDAAWRQYWDEKMLWYGPGGFGSYTTVDAFRDFQVPFEKTFEGWGDGRQDGISDVGIQCKSGDGDYAFLSGWPANYRHTTPTFYGYRHDQHANLSQGLRLVAMSKRQDYRELVHG